MVTTPAKYETKAPPLAILIGTDAFGAGAPAEQYYGFALIARHAFDCRVDRVFVENRARNRPRRTG